jgi:hypothetical protein
MRGIKIHKIFCLENLKQDVSWKTRWEDHIRMDLREIRLKSVDWMDLAQDRDQ